MAQLTGVPLLSELRAHREQIAAIAARHGASNVRVFGSVARGEATRGSDVDILVDVVPAGGFAYFGQLESLREELEALLGLKVDVIDSAALRRIRERVLHDAVAVSLSD